MHLCSEESIHAAEYMNLKDILSQMHDLSGIYMKVKKANEGCEMAQWVKVFVTTPDPCGGRRGCPLTLSTLA